MVTPIKYFILISTIFIVNPVSAAPALATVLVLIDEKTEKKLGAFPYERDVLSKGIEQLHELGAKEVLLKVFLDKHKDKRKDKSLANALSNLPVTLQARLDDSELRPNPLISGHKLHTKFKTIKSYLRAESGWLPIIEFSQKAKATGFIDSIYPVMFVETYKGDAVGSLYFHALESIYDVKIDVKQDRLYLADHELILNQKGEYIYDWSSARQPEYLSYIDLLEGNVESNKVAGKYVVLGYDGSKIHQVPTPDGLMNAHVAFYQSLLSVIANIEEVK